MANTHRCGPKLASKLTFAAVLLGAYVLSSLALSAQTYHILYSFTGTTDGKNPVGVVIDSAGNLYGTASAGGLGSENCSPSCGTVFKLAHKNSSWIFSLLYSFAGGNDGLHPVANVNIASDGTLYGSTAYGGGSGCTEFGCGTIFRLQPPARFCASVQCPWNETVLYRFNGNDGFYPVGQAFDAAGNLYGASWYGGGNGCAGFGCGTVFKLTRSGNNWSEQVLYVFNGGNSGDSPSAPVLDLAGNLYSLSSDGGQYQCGFAYKLTPSGQNWTFTSLYDFNPAIGDGCQPDAAMVFDQSGNLYGTSIGNSLGEGSVFRLSPAQNGSWSESVLYLDTSGFQDSIAPLIRDAAGNLYGTMFSAPGGWGSVFKLTPGANGWTFTRLHTFSCSDGAGPGAGALAIDAAGNLYGTASYCGAHQAGVVWEITPD